MATRLARRCRQTPPEELPGIPRAIFSGQAFLVADDTGFRTGHDGRAQVAHSPQERIIQAPGAKV